MDAKALNRALTTARTIEDIERALRGRDELLNAINCAAACGSAAKLSASRAGKFSTAPAAVADATRVILGVCDVATSAMTHEPRQWWPRQCSAMLWALGKVGARHKGLEDAIEVALEPRLDECKPQELSNALWGLAKVNSDRVGLIRMLGERIRRSLLVDKGTDHRTGWTTQGVSNAAWSLGSMTADASREMFEESALGEELVRGLATAVEERVLMFNPQECANTMWAFAKCSAFTSEAERGARALAARIRDEEDWMARGDFQCQHVSNVTWACAKMNMSDDKKLVDVLSEACKAYAFDLNAQELSMILWALATLAISDHTTMEVLANAAAEKAKESSAQQMATSAHALAKLGIYNASLMNAYKFHATQRRDEFQPRDVAFLAWAYAKLDVKAPKLFEMFSQVAGDMLYDPEYQTFTPHHLTMLLWSFAMLSEDTEALVPVVIRAMATMIDDFNARDLTNTAWALAALGCDDKSFITSIGACAQKKLNEFNSQELLKFLGSYERLGVEDKSLAEAVSSQRTLTYEFPALGSTIELTAATPQSYKGTDRVRVDDSCGGWGRGNTGVALWEGSFVLAEWLSRQKTPHSTAGIKDALDGAWGKDANWSGKVGVELGAGLGLPSIVASELGMQMIATDGTYRFASRLVLCCSLPLLIPSLDLSCPWSFKCGVHQLESFADSTPHVSAGQ